MSMSQSSLSRFFTPSFFGVAFFVFACFLCSSPSVIFFILLQYSLAMALEEMGFPTLHTQHLYENHALFDMWNKEIFLPSMAAGKTILGKPDLSLITSFGYQGTADLPMALYFEQVMEEYPNCKFILTTRDNSNVWFKSWDTLTESINPPAQRGGIAFASCQKLSNYFAWLYSHINKDTYFLTKPHPFPRQDRIEAIKSYEEHNRRVRALVPKERLLEYSVKQGWDPLCQFMNVTGDDCPTTPFPRSNSIRSVRIQAFVAQLTPIVVLAWATLYYVLRRSGRRTCKVD
jgi:hypothetical protein